MGSWLDRAACLGMDRTIFFSDPHDVAGTQAALAVCARCSVTEECLAWALEHPTSSGRFGIFGGTTPIERRRMLRLATAS